MGHNDREIIGVEQNANCQMYSHSLTAKGNLSMAKIEGDAQQPFDNLGLRCALPPVIGVLISDMSVCGPGQGFVDTAKHRSDDFFPEQLSLNNSYNLSQKDNNEHQVIW